MRSIVSLGSCFALPLVLAACSAHSLDDYESGSGGDGTGASGGSGGTAGTGGTGVGGSAGAASGGGSAGTGGSTGGTGGSTGGTGGSTGGTGGSTGGTGGSTGGTGGSTGGTGGSTGGTGGSTGGTGGTGIECGNSKLETGEECDDGNKTAGDGCDTNCKVVCTDVASGAVAHTSAGRVHCYWAIIGSNSWTDSQDKCQNAYKKKGHLVAIRSSGENTFVNQTFASSSSVWIGGTDGQPASSTSQDKYAWVNGETMLSYENFGSGEPDWAPCGTGCYEHRLIMKATGTWADVPASDSYVGVCEWEPPPG